MKTRKTVKTGVMVGGGEKPGYRWSVRYLTVARDEAMKVLDESQYHHIVDQFKELAYQKDPTHSKAVSVTKIENFFELRDKGGILGKLNIRAFFSVDKDTNNITVLGVIKKEADGKTPMCDKIRMRRRKREFEKRKQETKR